MKPATAARVPGSAMSVETRSASAATARNAGSPSARAGRLGSCFLPRASKNMSAAHIIARRSAALQLPGASIAGKGGGVASEASGAVGTPAARPRNSRRSALVWGPARAVISFGPKPAAAGSFLSRWPQAATAAAKAVSPTGSAARARRSPETARWSVLDRPLDGYL